MERYDDELAPKRESGWHLPERPGEFSAWLRDYFILPDLRVNAPLSEKWAAFKRIPLAEKTPPELRRAMDAALTG